MTTKADKQKQKKKRAAKRKHEHLTEQMAENHAKQKRTHREEVGVIIVLLIFVPFMVIGAIWWPSSPSTVKGKTGLPDGSYVATYMSARPATASEPAVAALEVNNSGVLVTESDLSGDAAKEQEAFFEGNPGQEVRIQVKNGFITEFSKVS